MQNQDKPKTPGRRGAARGGRRKLPEGVAKIARVGVYFSPADLAKLTANAGDFGLTIPDYIRRAALNRPLPPPPAPAVNRAEYAELARLSANLNQLTKAANEGRAVVVGDELPDLLAEVKRLRLALLGVE